MSTYDTDEFKSTKKKLKTVGTVLIIAGLLISIFSAIILITGFTSFLNTDISPGEEGLPGSDAMIQFIIGGFGLVIGFGLLGFGAQLFMTTHARTIARYAAVEGAPAAEIMSTAFASGISKGMRESGVSRSSSEKEVIRIKCRKCGYLETEDATFCSKCGNEI